MKNLLIALSLASSLILSSTAKAEAPESIATTEVETLVVVSIPEVANFEIYSLELAEAAPESMLDTASSVAQLSVTSDLSDAVTKVSF